MRMCGTVQHTRSSEKKKKAHYEHANYRMLVCDRCLDEGISFLHYAFPLIRLSDPETRFQRLFAVPANGFAPNLMVLFLGLITMSEVFIISITTSAMCVDVSVC